MFIFLKNIDKLDFFQNDIIEIDNLSDNEIILKQNLFIKKIPTFL
jgi:hypothetical protein